MLYAFLKLSFIGLLDIHIQDNDPKLTSGKVKAYMQSKSNAKNSRMSIMDWPSQSLDLNPLN